MSAVIAKTQARGIYPVINIVYKVEKALIFKAHIHAEVLSRLHHPLHAVDPDLAYRRIIISRRDVVNHAFYAERGACLHMPQQAFSYRLSALTRAPDMIYAVPRCVNVVDDKSSPGYCVGKVAIGIFAAEVKQDRIKAGRLYRFKAFARVGIYLSEMYSVLCHVVLLIPYKNIINRGCRGKRDTPVCFLQIRLFRQNRGRHGSYG